MYIVLTEMKAYTGGDEQLDSIQALRGFKTYRELYQKKNNEAEHSIKTLKETQKSIKQSHEKQCHQLFLFTELSKLMSLKSNYQKSLLANAAEQQRAGSHVVVSHHHQQDRLMLS